MAADMKQAERFVRELSALINKLSAARDDELIDASRYTDILQLRNSTQKKIELEQENDRTLRIGIVGSVKAGKSSFVNACLFDGVPILPTCATPKTAALTRITYSKHPQTVIHFCTQEDWALIEDGANSYSLDLDKAYNKYVADETEKAKQQKTKKDKISGLISGRGTEPAVNILSKEKFSSSKLFTDYSEKEKACREILDMVKNSSENLMSLIGQERSISLDELNDYVGADGKYTPVVSYVEMQTDNEELDGLMLVDTPGLEDPVLSRGEQTKKFLEVCDVVIMLSSSSQFMGDSTVKMIDQMPSAGVERVLVAASRLDQALMNDNHKSLIEASRSVAAANRSQYRVNIASLISDLRDDTMKIGILRQMEKAEPMLTSSVLYTAGVKLEKRQSLNEVENHSISKLKAKYSDFPSDPKELKSLSGINAVRSRLNGIISEKEEIINGKSDKLVSECAVRLHAMTEELTADTKRRLNDLTNGSEDEYRIKYEKICAIIDHTRRNMRHIYEIAADDCQKNEIIIESGIKKEISNHTRLKINKETKTEEWQTGALWWKKDHSETTTTYNISVAQVLNNLNDYFAACQQYIAEEFRLLVDKESISAKVKEVALSAYSNGKLDFSEDDILNPLESTLSKIEIPPYVINSNRFLDRVRSRFTAGHAKNDEIYELESMQSQLLSDASDEMIKELRKCAESIRQTLDMQAVCFSDEIEKRISSERDSVLKQMQEREKYKEKYESLLAELAEARNATRKYIAVNKGETSEQ